jgi:hypothetical protein
MARAPGSDASQRLAAAAGAVTPMSGSRTIPGSIAGSPACDFKALPLLARRMHPLAVVLAVASSAAGCVVPPPLQLDEPDAGANSPPTIISIRGDNAVEYQEQGVVALIRGQGSFTATLYDTDLDDTLYVRVFVNWTPENTVAANAACSATPLPTPSATRTATCDLVGRVPARRRRERSDDRGGVRPRAARHRAAAAPGDRGPAHQPDVHAVVLGAAAMSARVTVALGAFVTLGAAACLEVPAGPATPMCVDNSDCNVAAGEVCDESICWGDPPAGAFGVLAGAPLDRPGLTTSETQGVSIAPSGWFTVALEQPVTLAGRVVASCVSEGGNATGACEPGVSIDATVVVTRAPRIPGGPAFRVVVSSVGGLAEGPSFTVAVPRGAPGELYTVVAYPNRDPAVAGAVAPPERRQLEVTEAVDDCDFVVGAPQLRHLVGTVLDAGGAAMAGFVVVARGRWTADAPVEDLSTVGYTTESGAFELTLPAGLGSTEVDLVAAPPADRSLPTLFKDGVVLGGDVVTEVTPLQLPPLGESRAVQVRAVGTSGGSPVEVSGAEISLISSFDVFGPSRRAEARSPRAASCSTGPASSRPPAAATAAWRRSRCCPAMPARRPRMRSGCVRRRQPAARSTAQCGVSSATFRPPAWSAWSYPERVAIAGRLLDAAGEPATGVSVLSVPSATFAASLPAEIRSLLAQASAGDTLTDEHGDFVTWVDRRVDGAPAAYDLRFVPQGGSLLPRWQLPEFEVTGSGDVDLGDVHLPEASYVRAVVQESAEPGSAPVSGADVASTKCWPAPSRAAPTARSSSAPACPMTAASSASCCRASDAAGPARDRSRGGPGKHRLTALGPPSMVRTSPPPRQFYAANSGA